MAIVIELDKPLLKWQARYGKRMTYAELAKRTDISLPTLYRLKAGKVTHPDLRKLNRLCKVLECEPADIFRVEDTNEETLEEVKDRLEKRARMVKRVRRAGAG